MFSSGLNSLCSIGWPGFLILLPQPFECWGDRHVPPFLASNLLLYKASIISTNMQRLVGFMKLIQNSRMSSLEVSGVKIRSNTPTMWASDVSPQARLGPCAAHKKEQEP